ncbi:MAG: molecular chaperone DnaK [Deltaproteobacteria bacterium]|nr:molecular chaperone DnaK [Deltaproteobacteria bacterium]
MGKIIGIDLGTTNSVVAVIEGKDVKVISNEEGSRLTPSVVAWDEKGETLVGNIAKRQAVTNPENTVYSIKRFMGMKAHEQATESKRVPYKVVTAPNGDAHVDVRGKRMSPPEVSAKILQKLKKAAENYLGETVTEAVITVPAYFNDSQRQATKDAGKIAGLDVKRIINEPTAAALAYGLDKKKDELIAVYDFGGGTFDISILEVGDNIVQVKSTNGDTHLGGDDIDQRVMQYLIDEFKKDSGIDLSKDKMVLQRLKDAAERAKIELSSMLETDINLPFLTADQNGPKHMNIRLSRAKLEQLMDEIIERTLEPCRRALEDAAKRPGDINEVVLVGGSTRIPKVQEAVKKLFAREPNRSVNPDEVVAIGAAVQGGVLAGDVKDLLLLDVTSLSLGIETLGGVCDVLIPRNTTIPTKKERVYSTASDNQTQVEVHVLQGERKMASGNRTLGKFTLGGIPTAPRGVPQILVTFDIDANGIVHVAAKDKATSKENTIKIEASSGLSKDEVERMVNEAKASEEDDKKRFEEVEARNRLDAMVYEVEKQVKDLREKAPADALKEVDTAIAVGKEALESKDADQMRAAYDRIQAAMHKVAEAAYKAAGAGPGDGGSAAGGGGGASGAGGGNGTGKAKRDDNVIDAEFEENK